jgi:glycosyltransferase involved in cell wall biosynthesis
VEQVADLGLARQVHFTGFLAGSDVDRAYREADLYVLPSLSEPFGITPLEAAQRGVPVLVSRRSGVAEVLPSAMTFDPADVPDLAAKILRVLASRSVRRRSVEKARREIGRLTWDAQAARLRSVWAELPGASPRTPTGVGIRPSAPGRASPGGAS